MIAVFHTQMLSEAHAVVAALTGAGIAAVITGEHSLGTIAGGVTVHVASVEEVAPARRVIEGLHPPDPGTVT